MRILINEHLEEINEARMQRRSISFDGKNDGAMSISQ